MKNFLSVALIFTVIVLSMAFANWAGTVAGGLIAALFFGAIFTAIVLILVRIGRNI